MCWLQLPDATNDHLNHPHQLQVITQETRLPEKYKMLLAPDPFDSYTLQAALPQIITKYNTKYNVDLLYPACLKRLSLTEVT